MIVKLIMEDVHKHVITLMDLIFVVTANVASVRPVS